MKQLYILFILITSVLYSQEHSIIVFSDSISKLSIRELDDFSIDLESISDTLKGKLVAKELVFKSKFNKDLEYVARGFYSLSNLESQSNLKEKYIDSMLFFSNLSKQKYLQTDSYYLLANVEYFKGNYQKAMELLSKAYQFAVLDENVENQKHVSIRMASIKNVLQRHYEAYSIYKNAYNDYNDVDFVELEQRDNYVDLVYNLSLTFEYLKQFDSVLYYSKKGQNLLALYKNEEYGNAFKRSEALGYWGKGEHNKAIKLFHESLNGLSPHDLAQSYYYMGSSYINLNKVDEAIALYVKSDSVLVASNASPYPGLKKAYKELFRYYRSREDKIKSNTYLEKYIALDSSINERNSAISGRMHYLYNIPRIKAENEKILQKKKINTIIITVLLLFLIATLLLLLYQKKRAKLQKKQIEKLIGQDNSKSFEEFSSSPVLDIATTDANYKLKDEVKSEILSKLLLFEQKKEYLNSSITSTRLAKELDTNSSYLSTIINSHKGINFATYLKILRINNAIDTLKMDEVYLKYSMNGLAGEFGFNSADAFSKAFKEITKIKPSVFIKELIKSKNLP